MKEFSVFVGIRAAHTFFSPFTLGYRVIYTNDLVMFLYRYTHFSLAFTMTSADHTKVVFPKLVNSLTSKVTTSPNMCYCCYYQQRSRPSASFVSKSENVCYVCTTHWLNCLIIVVEELLTFGCLETLIVNGDVYFHAHWLKRNMSCQLKWFLMFLYDCVYPHINFQSY